MPAPRPSFACLFLGAAVLVAGAAAAPAGGGPAPVTGLAIFGDSLSDTGRYFALTGEPGPPYFEGRFSNGRVWCEDLGPMLGLAADEVDNRAVGFAPTADLLELQVPAFLADAGGVADPAALHVLFAGANDFRLLLEDPALDPVEVLETAVANHVAAIEVLHAAGATRFCVFNLPDLGTTPLVTQAGDPFLVALATAVSAEYNAQLAVALDAVEARTGIELVRVDAFAVLNGIVDEPAAFGFVNATDRAFDERSGRIAEPVDGYLFWDDLHPTRSGHAVIRDHVADRYGVLRPEDVDRDGRAGFADLLAVLTAWGPCPAGPCTPDVTGDGAVDAADLAAVAAGWDA